MLKGYPKIHVHSLVLISALLPSTVNGMNAAKLVNAPAQPFSSLLEDNHVLSADVWGAAKPVSKLASVGDVLKQDPIAVGRLLSSSEPKVSEKPIAATPGAVALETPIPTIKKMDSIAAPKRKIKALLPTRILSVFLRDGSVEFAPKKLNFDRANQTIDVSIDPQIAASIFVRNNKLISWDHNTQELRALKAGNTELYLVVGKDMHIVPATIKLPSSPLEMTVSSDLDNLDGVFNSAANAALYPGVAAIKPPSADNSEVIQSKADTIASVDQRENDRKSVITGAAKKVMYRDVDLQIVDERTAVKAKKIYPVSGVQLRVAGTEFVGETDVTGHITIPDMPEDSRFLIYLDDPSGFSYPATIEISTQGEPAMIRATVLRSMAFDALTSIAGVVQNAEFGSICGSLKDFENDLQPVSETSVQLDIDAEGPYYFNRYGYLDVGMASTGPDGRFCFFNVPSGPVAATLSYESEQFALVPLAIIAGRHLEESIFIGVTQKLQTNIAAVSTAHEQLGSNTILANAMRPIDFADLVPFGPSGPMIPLKDGLLDSSELVFGHGGRILAISQTAEFESVVYSYAVDASENFTPFYPRGFLEDMSLFAQTTVEQGMGTIIAEHSPMLGQEPGPAQILVYDQFDRQMQDGWVYQDMPTSKVIYFNLPAGVYQVISKTEGGDWVSARTAFVYSDTISHVRTGSDPRIGD